MGDRIPDLIQASDQTVPAIVWGDHAITYGELDRRIAGSEESIANRGLTRGDRLALWYPHEEASPETTLATIVAFAACWRLGVVVAPLSIRLPESSARELANGLGAEFVDPREISGHLRPADRTEPWRLDAAATIVHTSGTMGEPKAALHSINNHVASARGWAARIPTSPTDRWLLDLPLDHVGGIAVVVRCLLVGGCLVLPRSNESRLEVMRRAGVTFASAVELQLRRLMDHGGPPPDGLRMLLLGGSAASGALVRDARRQGWPVVPSYGLTEMSSTVTALGHNMPDETLDTSGAVLPGRKVVIHDDGEIRVGGPMRFLGYVDSGNLLTPFDDQGYFATGDLGEWVPVGEERLLRVTGRKDNRFKSGGEQVVPEAIEAELMEIEGVRRAVVVAVPDVEFGHRPVAFVDLKEIDDEELRRQLEQVLPGFMVPDLFLPWPTVEEDPGSDVIAAKPRRNRLCEIARREMGS